MRAEPCRSPGATANVAILALAVLLMLSRGSTRLVKLDVAGIARRTWRI